MTFSKSDLAQFTGTCHWYRYPTGHLVTDGVKFLMDNGCGWIVDLIISHQLTPKVREENMQFWTITKNEDNSASVVCTDGGKEGNEPVVLATQKVLFTDMPVKEIKIYLVDDGENKVLMIPSEY